MCPAVSLSVPPKTHCNRPQPLRQPPPTACLTAPEIPSNASLWGQAWAGAGRILRLFTSPTSAPDVPSTTARKVADVRRFYKLWPVPKGGLANGPCECWLRKLLVDRFVEQLPPSGTSARSHDMNEYVLCPQRTECRAYRVGLCCLITHPSTSDGANFGSGFGINFALWQNTQKKNKFVSMNEVCQAGRRPAHCVYEFYYR
jgi:hypothetical protein